MSNRQRELAKDLNLTAALTIGVGTMIGAGIFVLPAVAAASTGPAAGIAFVVAGFIALFTALSISELRHGDAKIRRCLLLYKRFAGAAFWVSSRLGQLARTHFCHRLLYDRVWELSDDLISCA